MLNVGPGMRWECMRSTIISEIVPELIAEPNLCKLKNSHCTELLIFNWLFLNAIAIFLYK